MSNLPQMIATAEKVGHEFKNGTASSWDCKCGAKATNDVMTFTEHQLRALAATGLSIRLEEGPEDGHTFEITMRSRGSFNVTGDPKRDALWWSEPRSVQVRAWDLVSALAKAACLPLTEWYKEEQET